MGTADLTLFWSHSLTRRWAFGQGSFATPALGDRPQLPRMFCSAALTGWDVHAFRTWLNSFDLPRGLNGWWTEPVATEPSVPRCPPSIPIQQFALTKYQPTRAHIPYLLNSGFVSLSVTPQDQQHTCPGLERRQGQRRIAAATLGPCSQPSSTAERGIGGELDQASSMVAQRKQDDGTTCGGGGCGSAGGPRCGMRVWGGLLVPSLLAGFP